MFSSLVHRSAPIRATAVRECKSLATDEHSAVRFLRDPSADKEEIARAIAPGAKSGKRDGMRTRQYGTQPFVRTPGHSHGAPDIMSVFRVRGGNPAPDCRPHRRANLLSDDDAVEAVG